MPTYSKFEDVPKEKAAWETTGDLFGRDNVFITNPDEWVLKAHKDNPQHKGRIYAMGDGRYIYRDPGHICDGELVLRPVITA